MEVSFKTLTGRNITLEFNTLGSIVKLGFENPELVKHVKVRLTSEIHIYVEAGSERFKLKAEYTQTVGSLKNLIDQTKKSNICVSNMRLEYLGKVLEDSQTLADHDIQDGAILILKHSQSIKIFFKIVTGKTLTLDVPITETIGTVKAQLEELAGIPSDQQRFIYKGKDLRDELSLADYNIQALSNISIVFKH